MHVLPDRLTSKISVSDGCWQWTASLRDGYGQVRFGARTVSAHRLVYELLVGPVGPGLELDHLCRNRACVNPAHLEQVSHRENVRRGTGRAAQNALKSQCPQGHPYDEVQGGARRCSICRIARQSVTRSAARDAQRARVRRRRLRQAGL